MVDRTISLEAACKKAKKLKNVELLAQAFDGEMLKKGSQIRFDDLGDFDEREVSRFKGMSFLLDLAH